MWIFRCWTRLNADRPWYGGGMGPMMPGPIPWLTIVTYAAHHDYDDGQIHILDHCLRAMDAVFIANYQAKVSKK